MSYGEYYMKTYLNRFLLIVLLIFGYSISAYAVCNKPHKINLREEHHVSIPFTGDGNMVINEENVNHWVELFRNNLTLDQRILGTEYERVYTELRFINTRPDVINACLTTLKKNGLWVPELYVQYSGDYEKGVTKLADILKTDNTLQIFSYLFYGENADLSLLAFTHALRSNRSLRSLTITGAGSTNTVRRETLLEMYAILAATNITLEYLNYSTLQGIISEQEKATLDQIRKLYLDRNNRIEQINDLDDFESHYRMIMILLHGTQEQRETMISKLRTDRQNIAREIVNFQDEINRNLLALGAVNRFRLAPDDNGQLQVIEDFLPPPEPSFLPLPCPQPLGVLTEPHTFY